MRLLLVIGIVVHLLFLAFASVLVAGRNEKGKLNNSFTSSQVCRQCHMDIYNSWKGSLHARSLSDPVFDAAYMRFFRQSPDEARSLCLRCHAPVAYLSGDPSLKREVSQEGIICDFCHSVTGVDLSQRPFPFSVDPGKKRGPWKMSSSPAHATEYSTLFEKSLLCAGCHEYSNPKAVPIISTFSEWLESPYPFEGKECQSCHMPRVPGVVALIGKSSQKKTINLHEPAGGHYLEQLRKAVKVQIAEARTDREKLYVTVKVTNIGSGHMVPTGIPTRKLILKVTVEASGKSPLTQQVVYRKILVDDQGQEVTQDSEIFTRPARIAQDNRLAPRETRQQTFVFSTEGYQKPSVKAELRYYYAPLVLQPVEMDVNISSDTRSPTSGRIFK